MTHDCIWQKQKTLLQSLIDFSHPHAPFVHLIFCIFFFLFVLYFLYIYFLSFCLMPFSLGLYTYNFFRFPSITLWNSKKTEPSSFSTSVINPAQTDIHRLATDKQKGGRSYLGLIWRRCPCPASFCGDTKGKVIRNSSLAEKEQHLTTQTIYVLCWPWAGTLPSRSIYTIPVKLLSE